MRECQIGQVRGRHLAGVLVDRGCVVSVCRDGAHGFRHAQVTWECGDQSYDEEHVLHVVSGAITDQDLTAAGIDPTDFGCGGATRRTECAWSIRAADRRRLGERLEAQAFDIDDDVTAIKVPSGDAISLRQELPLG